MRRMSLFVLIALSAAMISLMSCSDSKSPTESPPGSAQGAGAVYNEDSDPIYGAKVSLGGSTVYTAADGSFSLTGLSTGNATLIVECMGYQDKSISFSIVAGDNYFGDIEMVSYNLQHIQTVSDPTSAATVSTALQYMGMTVDNSDATGQSITDTHVNGILNLVNLNKAVTLAEMANELNVNGVSLDGNWITPEQLVDFSNTLIEAAYHKPSNPLFYLPLYLAADENGQLPAQAPVLTTNSELPPVKASIYYLSLLFLAYNPDLQAIGGVAASGTGADWSWEEFVAAVAGVPYSSGEITDPGEIAAGLGGEYAGRIMGIGLCAAVAGGLTVVSHGTAVPVAAFMLSPAVTQVVSGATGYMGSEAATWIYRVMWNLLGEPRTPDDTQGVILNGSGEISIASDIRVNLTWEGGPYTDVDIHLIDPNGERTYWANSLSQIGAELDVDDLDGYGPENITLEQGEAIDGTYVVEVNFYDDEGAVGEPIYATVMVTLHEGSPEEIIWTYGPQGIFVCDWMLGDPDAWWSVTTFTYPGGLLAQGAGPVRNLEGLKRVK